MDEDEFQAFGVKAQEAVDRRMALIHERYGLEHAARWRTAKDPKQDVPHFQILDAADKILFECVCLEVGSFSPSTSSWKWGWANDSLSSAHRERLLPLRELAAVTNRAAFQFENPFETDLDSAWIIAAIAAEHLGAAGCHDAKIKNLKGEVLHTYLAYMEIVGPESVDTSSETTADRRVTAENEPDDTRPANVVSGAHGDHATAQDRPRGMVSFNIPMTGAEVLFFEHCLKTLDRDPSFEDLDSNFRRGFSATPERVLGELQPLSHKEQRVPVSFRFRGKDGDPHDICDITSLNVDIAALAMLIAVAVPSAQPGGFTYTPMGEDYDRDDPRLLSLPDGGLVKITLATIEIIDNGVPPARELRRWKFHVP